MSPLKCNYSACWGGGFFWIYYFTTPPQFTFEYADKSSLIHNQLIDLLLHKGKGWLAVFSGLGSLLRGAVITLFSKCFCYVYAFHKHGHLQNLMNGLAPQKCWLHSRFCIQALCFHLNPIILFWSVSGLHSFLHPDAINSYHEYAHVTLTPSQQTTLDSIPIWSWTHPFTVQWSLNESSESLCRSSSTTIPLAWFKDKLAASK